MTEEFELLTLDPQPALAIRGVVPNDQLAMSMDGWLPTVFRFVTGNGVELAGPPFSRYHRIGEQETDLETGLPVATPHPGDGHIQPVELPGGETASAWHVGPYDRLPETHAALAEWVADQGRTPAGPVWEVYWTDPGQEPDPAKWRTQVLLPLR
jgi:AraC family transcriptional regulator